MEALAEMLRDLGSSLKGLTAHVFGGARILAGPKGAMDLGTRNSEFALDWLERSQVLVTTLDVGGTVARRIEFSLVDGSASLRRIGGS
jgi:chemotaxis protein CheD